MIPERVMSSKGNQLTNEQSCLKRIRVGGGVVAFIFNFIVLNRVMYVTLCKLSQDSFTVPERLYYFLQRHSLVPNRKIVLS